LRKKTGAIKSEEHGTLLRKRKTVEKDRKRDERKKERNKDR
jgi:hypothetical protein